MGHVKNGENETFPGNPKNKRNNWFFKDFKLTSILQLFTKCHNFGVFKAKNMLDTFLELSCQGFS